MSLHAQDDFDYPAAWRVVDSLERLRQTRDVLARVQEIAAQADRDGKDPQWIKALIYELKANSFVTEDADSLAIKRVRAAIDAAPTGPRRAILLSMLGEMYIDYYETNAWEISERTRLDSATEDFRTWDAASFLGAAAQAYLASLDDRSLLQTPAIRDYADILETGEQSDTYRPSLYDLLAHRAIDFFVNTANTLPESQEAFQLPEDIVFLPTDAFVQARIETGDSTSHTYRVLRLYQDLLAYHIDTQNPYAIADLDLKRLAYARGQATGDDKEQQYLAALGRLADWHNQHPVQADVYYEIARWYAGQAERYDPLRPDDSAKWAYKTAYERCAETVRTYPGSRGAKNCAALQAMIAQQQLVVQLEDVQVPDQPFRMLVGYRQIAQVYGRIIRSTPQLERELEKVNYYEHAARAAILARQTAYKTFEQALPDDGDLHTHRTEVPLPALPLGRYYLLLSNTPSPTEATAHTAYAALKVSDIAFHSFREEGGSYRYMVRSRTQGYPLAGVKAEVYYGREDKKNRRPNASLTSDANGVVRVQPMSANPRFEVVFTLGPDTYTDEQYNYWRDEEPAPVKQTTILLDRKIYRPGQTIYFKGIHMLRTGDRSNILPGMALDVVFRDANYQEISRLRVQTNEYGSFSGTFVAPTGGLTGVMRIECEGGSTDLNVEEYKRPTFEVQLDPPAGDYALGDTLSLRGTAKAYTGAAIGDAEVRYRVRRQVRYPYWWWWRPMPEGGDKEIASGSVQTRADGSFEVPVALVPDAKVARTDNPVFTYEVYVDVIDISGETHSSSRSVRAAYTPYELRLDLPDLLHSGSKLEAQARAHNFGGEPVTVQGSLAIYPVVAPQVNYRDRRWDRPDRQVLSEAAYRKRFPRDRYADESNEATWPLNPRLLEQRFDTGDTTLLSLAAMKNAKPGRYKAVLRTSDSIEIVRYFTWAGDQPDQPVVPVWLDATFDKTQAEPGDTVRLHLRSSEPELWVQVMVMQKNHSLREELVRLKGSRTLVIPIVEAHRGGWVCYISYHSHNQQRTIERPMQVPWTNKELKLSWSTFRSELYPGQQEQWRLTIAGPRSEVVAAEMVATLYDASLDVFRSNAYGLSLYPGYTWSAVSLRSSGYGEYNATGVARDNDLPDGYNQRYDMLNWFGYHIDYSPMVRSQIMPTSAPGGFFLNNSSSDADLKFEFFGDTTEDADGVPDLFDAEPEMSPAPPQSETPPQPQAPQIRSNLNETAFFFPHLRTNAQGEIVLEFTMPEALTRWKFLGLAHTQDLMVGSLMGETVTKKDLMVVPNLPRFLREGDRVRLATKVVNTSDRELTGTARLDLLDASLMQAADTAFGNSQPVQPFTVAAGQSVVLHWDLAVPEAVQALMTRVVAQAGDFSDGQENVLPILPNRMLVTETLPMYLRGKQKSATFTLDKLAQAGESSTLRHQRLTLEVTSNPAWYAVQALPYLMEFPHACSEQIYSRFYANALATHIANSTPRIRKVFDQWRSMPAGTGLVSQLEKNQELKSALLEETPWVLQAQNESERKRNIALLFDLNKMAAEQAQARHELALRQSASGGWAWFPGMNESPYITCLIATGFGELQKLGVGVAGDPELVDMRTRAVRYLDGDLANDYARLKASKADLDQSHLGPYEVQYLYMRSFFPDQTIDPAHREAYDYYMSQALRYWYQQDFYMMAMLAMVFDRTGNETAAGRVIEALRQNAVRNRELGMYWKEISGFYWYQAPIERQAMLITAFAEVADDAESVEEMQVWLLQHKRTNDWGTTRATAAACQALLRGGQDWLAETAPVQVRVGGETIDPFRGEGASVEAGTGYYQTSWTAAEIRPEMGTVTLQREQRGLAWAALYWQYFEDLDKITYAETPLSIRKSIYREDLTPQGPTLVPLETAGTLHPGDKLVVRIELRVDREMEYVHLKDMRGAGLEPMQVLSRYRYQGGLGYYESTRDIATHFFIDYLPAGTWVLEYPLRVNLPGDFSNGIATVQCMYAPEFTSHSEGVRIQAE
ncbi:MAG: alpha-2-macroglobulin family protein [Bacteroidia bacterium]